MDVPEKNIGKTGIVPEIYGAQRHCGVGRSMPREEENT